MPCVLTALTNLKEANDDIRGLPIANAAAVDYAALKEDELRYAIQNDKEIDFLRKKEVMAILKESEGCFCYLLNKISQGIREGWYPPLDHFEILTASRTDLIPELRERYYEDMVFVGYPQVLTAFKNYIFAVSEGM